MSKTKRSFSRDMLSKLVNNILGDANNKFIQDDLDIIINIKFKIKEKLCIVFSCEESIYLFRIDKEKNDADTFYICEECNLVYDKFEFAKLLNKSEELSNAGYDVICGKLELSKYIITLTEELIKDSRRINTQKEIAFKEIMLFNFITILDIQKSRIDALQRIKEKALSLLEVKLNAKQATC